MDNLEGTEGALFSNKAISSHLDPDLLKHHQYGKPFPIEQNYELFEFLDIRAKNQKFLESYPVFEALYDLGHPIESINSMLRCGSINGYLKRNCYCGGHTIPLRNNCNQRTCPYCSNRRKKRIRERYMPFIKNYSTNPRASEFIYFLTISPANYEDYEEGLIHIRKSFNKFIRNRYIHDRVKAGLYVIESKTKNKYGEEKGWNVHIHAIIYGRWLDNRHRGKCLDCGQNLIKFDYTTKRYSCANKKCNSLNVIYKQDSKIVELFKKCSGREVNVHISRMSSSGFALNYMLKYVSSSKEDFATPQDMAEFIFRSRKQRLINSFGLFFNLKLTKPIHICDECHQIFQYEFVPILEDSYSQSPDPPSTDQLNVITEVIR